MAAAEDEVRDERPEAPEPLEDAPSAALRRARAQAAADGLRPGRAGVRSGARGRTDRRAAAAAAAAKGRGSTDGRDLTLLGEEIEGLIADRGWEVDVAAGSVVGRWLEIVGAEVAAHSEPISFELGKLVVRADSTAWATQLRLLRSTLMGRIETEAGPGVVTDLQIVGPSAPSWSKGPRKVSDGRGQRDTYG